MNKTAVAIVTHNNEHTITKCVQSLQRANISRIVIVDNASQDKTVEILHTLSVTAIVNATNKGFGAAINQGVAALINQATLPAYFLFINPDAELQSSLDVATAVFEADPQIGIIGLGLEDSDGKPETFAYGMEPTLWSLIKKGKTYQSEYQLPDWVSGAAMLIRRQTFEQLKGFNEEFFMYWEDVDLCRRARVGGWKVVIEPTIKVRHERGASLSNKRVKARLYDASADKYFKKHYSPSIWLLQRFLRHLYRLVSPYSR
ncbi:MAG: glycosyltransferase family 2 protein [Candidatus Andersenbacteria bacterium]|nr:glycosyltransferase family 2 protein [Candidatus Andersenbacteria bacterium]MBI3250754.1 glycosyltransferase family 2 protein [Candidatus Andersenbacteria bacterium]